MSGTSWTTVVKLNTPGGSKAALATVWKVQGLHLDALSAGYWGVERVKLMLSSGFQMFLVA